MSPAATLACQQERIMVQGELNFTTVVSLWNNSLPKLAAYSSLHFDLTHVTVSNSGGVALILGWIKYAKEKNKSITFNNIPASLLSILSVSGVSGLLNSASS